MPRDTQAIQYSKPILTICIGRLHLPMQLTPSLPLQAFGDTVLYPVPWECYLLFEWPLMVKAFVAITAVNLLYPQSKHTSSQFLGNFLPLTNIISDKLFLKLRIIGNSTCKFIKIKSFMELIEPKCSAHYSIR